MTPWKKIACAVDLSEFTSLVVDHAAALAGWLHADLALLHVLSPMAPSALDVLPAGDSRELECAVQHELAAWADQAQAAVGRRVSTSVVRGQPAREILRFAATSGADAIVIGTHGRRGFERLVLGSVAELVVRQARCPVVIVREPAEEAAGAVEAR